MQTPTLYSAFSTIFVTFEDPTSAAVKAQYAKWHGLGGMMAWDLSSDNGDLLAALYAGLI